MRRITASFSIRKRVRLNVLGANVIETIRIPVNPVIALGAMVVEKLFSRQPKKRRDQK